MIAAVGADVLVGMSGDIFGETYAVGTDTAMVGRSLDAAIRLVNGSVSRFHARLVRDPAGALLLADLNSSHGTFVNGVRVENVALRDGDRVRFGRGGEFVIRYGTAGPDTLDIDDPEDDDADANEVLAARNLGRLQLAAGELESAARHLGRAVTMLETFPLAAPEDLGELLTDLGRCRLELGDAVEASALLRRAVSLLQRTSSAERSLLRAQFVLGRALFAQDVPARDRAEAVDLVRGVLDAVGAQDPLGQDVGAWLSTHANADSTKD